jgi:polysaccharide pyruvyl transferase WcaK-like protein
MHESSSVDVIDKTRPVVAYRGWHGRGNLGDDAIYDAVRAQLPDARFVDFPMFPHERIRAAATGLSQSLRCSTQILGGGTLVGRRDWRRWVNRGMALTRKNGSCAIGVGVEDPVFVGRRSGSDNGELKRWAPILSEFHSVSVRGPRSAELLSDVGLTVKVSGDPALLLPPPSVDPEDGLIGVNLGFGDDLWGHDPQQVVDEVAAAVRQLASGGHRFVGILMNSSDRKWTEAVLTGVTADIVAPPDATAAARELGRCSVAIVSRLHAGILASLSGTPVLSLEYQPKCRDFALSIDDERSLLRTDNLRSGAVVEAVEDALANSSSIRADKLAAVNRLRCRLQHEYSAVRTRLSMRDR